MRPSVSDRSTVIWEAVYSFSGHIVSDYSFSPCIRFLTVKIAHKCEPIGTHSGHADHTGGEVHPGEDLVQRSYAAR